MRTQAALHTVRAEGEQFPFGVMRNQGVMDRILCMSAKGHLEREKPRQPRRRGRARREPIQAPRGKGARLSDLDVVGAARIGRRETRPGEAFFHAGEDPVLSRLETGRRCKIALKAPYNDVQIMRVRRTVEEHVDENNDHERGMTSTEALVRAMCDAYRRFGEHDAAPGATDADVARIKEVFAELDFPLPDALIDIYRITMGIPGLVNEGSLLVAPFNCCGHDIMQWLDRLVTASDTADRENVLFLGFSNQAELLIDRDGRCGTQPDYPETGYRVTLSDPSDFPTAFSRFAQLQLAEIADEFGPLDHGD